MWGTNGDIPVPADYDGDGQADVAVWRPTGGAWYFSYSSGIAPYSEAWGVDGDVPVPADYDGDARADMAVFRPGGGGWYKLSSTGGPASSVIWGITTDTALAADFDGDTRADLTPYRSVSGAWYPLSSAEATFDHDSRGNRTRTTRTDTNTAWNYTYDQANRMTTAPGATYTYRGDGLRMAKDPGVPTTFAWDESGSMPMLLAEKTSSGTTRYIYGPTGSPIARVDNNDSLYYHHDQLGSIRAITDEDGDTVGTATYDPYGTRTHHSGITTPFGFAGEYTDTETGFQYLRARYYDPATATFLTRDPIEAITQEPYGYVGGNPLNLVDPLGLRSEAPTIVGCPTTSAVIGSCGFTAVPSGPSVAAIVQPTGVPDLSRTGGASEIDPSIFAGGMTNVITGSDTSGSVVCAESEKPATGVTAHGVNQKINRGVRSEDEIDALSNPLDIRPVVHDEFGRPSQRYVGRNAEVVINPDSRKIISVNPTSTAKANRLSG